MSNNLLQTSKGQSYVQDMQAYQTSEMINSSSKTKKIGYGGDNQSELQMNKDGSSQLPGLFKKSKSNVFNNELRAVKGFKSNDLPESVLINQNKELDLSSVNDGKRSEQPTTQRNFVKSVTNSNIVVNDLKASVKFEGDHNPINNFKVNAQKNKDNMSEKDTQDQQVGNFNLDLKRNQTRSANHLSIPTAVRMKHMSAKNRNKNEIPTEGNESVKNDSILKTLNQRHDNESYLKTGFNNNNRYPKQAEIQGKDPIQQFEMFDVYFHNKDLDELKQNKYINQRIEKIHTKVHKKKEYIEKVQKRSEYVRNVASRILSATHYPDEYDSIYSKCQNYEDTLKQMNVDGVALDMTQDSLIDRSNMVSARCSTGLRKPDLTTVPQIHVPVTLPKELKTNMNNKAVFKRRLESATDELNELLRLRNLKHQFDQYDKERDHLESIIKEVRKKRKELENAHFEGDLGAQLLKDVNILYNKLVADQLEETASGMKIKYDYHMSQALPKNAHYQPTIFKDSLVLKHCKSLHIQPSQKFSQKEYANNLYTREAANKILALKKPAFNPKLDTSNIDDSIMSQKEEESPRSSGNALLVLLASKMLAKPKKIGSLRRIKHFDGYGEEPTTDFDEFGCGFELNMDIEVLPETHNDCLADRLRNNSESIVDSNVKDDSPFAQLMREQSLKSKPDFVVSKKKNQWDSPKKSAFFNKNEVKEDLEKSYCGNPFQKGNKGALPSVFIRGKSKNSLQKKLSVQLLDDYLDKSTMAEYQPSALLMNSKKLTNNFDTVNALKETTDKPNHLYNVGHKQTNKLNGRFNKYTDVLDKQNMVSRNLKGELGNSISNKQNNKTSSIAV